MLKEYLGTSLESINHQYDGLLMKELSALIDRFTSEPESHFAKAKRDFAKDVKDVVKSRTGINIKIGVTEDWFANAWVWPPQIDRNHPLLTDAHRYFSERDGIKKIKKDGTILKGTVDLRTGKVDGIFSEIEVNVCVTRGLILSGNFLPEEIAAIIIHELGHVFTYYEYLGSGITTNYALADMNRRLTNTIETKRRIQIVKDTCEALDVDLENPEALVASNNDVVLQTVVLREVVEKRISGMGSSTYDLTAWEMMSDQFVSRHGGGRHLVTGLDKMMRAGAHTSYHPAFYNHAVEVLKILTVIGLANVFAPIVILAALIFFDTNEDLYDKPKARMERIRRDMVASLKDDKLPTEIARKTVEDIEVIENITKEMEDRRTYLQFFWSTFRTKGRRNYQQMKFQQELEILASNEIFTRAAKLRTIKL